MLIMATVLDKPEKKEIKRFEEPVLSLRDPLRMLDWMREEIDRLFEAAPFSRLLPTTRLEMPWMPPLEVFEKEGNLHIRVDLPGLKKEDVTIEATAEGITIKGERKKELVEEKKEEGYFRTERAYGEFSRFVPLPEGASIDEIKAKFADGVLEIITPIPAAKKAQPKKVAID
jgi:HSP20 family protein